MLNIDIKATIQPKETNNISETQWNYAFLYFY